MKKEYSEEDYKKPDEGTIIISRLVYKSDWTMSLHTLSYTHADFMDRTVQHRMPWHDVACLVEGPIVTDFAWHFVQRYNHESGAAHLPVSKNTSSLAHANMGCGICRYQKKKIGNCQIYTARSATTGVLYVHTI